MALCVRLLQIHIATERLPDVSKAIQTELISCGYLVCSSHQLQVCRWSYYSLFSTTAPKSSRVFRVFVFWGLNFSYDISIGRQLHCRPSELVVGGTLSLPRSHARILYLAALVTKALLGLAAWRLLQHGGLSPNIDAYGIYIILLSVGPLCRLYSCSSVQQKRNLCPDIAGMYYPLPCAYQVSQVDWGDHPRSRVETEDLFR